MNANRQLLAGLALARGDIDRAAEHRDDIQWLSDSWAHADTRVLELINGTVELGQSASSAIAWLSPTDVTQADWTDLFFLGKVDAVAHFAVASPLEAPDAEALLARSGLREIGSTLSDAEAGLLTTAVALANWHATHRRCPRCGTPTESISAGWARRCPADESLHFPRTDPAVIALVVDADDRALLGRQVAWPEHFFSTLAGFVEAGESAEAAVRREVFEESGVEVDDVTYLGSQPWPFPASLMLGYHARAVPGSEIRVDGTEIAEAYWYSREELVTACKSGEVRLPSSVSIARRLIERWFGSELPGEWSRP